MATTQKAAPDLAAIKARQQVTWTSGDYHAVAARIAPIAERLVEEADLPAGARVLDVAARLRQRDARGRPGRVPGDRSRLRARAAGARPAPGRAEGLPAEFVEGDAEALPYPDGSFDAVLSCVGVMFAPDQERAAAELVRVCRPGGTIALANWTPASFVGGVLRTVGKYVPPPAGLKPPGLWGTRERLEELLGGSVSELRVTEREYVFRFRTAG